MPCFPTVEAFALEGLLRLAVVCSVKVHWAFMVAIGCLVSPSIVVASERLTSVSLLSGVSNYRLVDRLLSLTLHPSLVESVIDTHHELNIVCELA